MVKEKVIVKENNIGVDNMNKKIISIFFLLIIFISITLGYSYYISNSNEQQYNSPIQTISDNNISEEIDETFIEEDDEIEIGEMV